MEANFDPAANDRADRIDALVSRAEIMVDLGRLDEAEAALDEAAALAEPRSTGVYVRAFVNWGRARVAAARDDAYLTERLLREVDRLSAGREWFSTRLGRAFLLDAAELLDRVGLSDQADSYFDRARALDVGADEQRDFTAAVAATGAALAARRGDPLIAIDALERLLRADQIDQRRRWRYLLLAGWAVFRAGRDGASQFVADALDAAVSRGSIEVALVGEPLLTLALAPLGERAGSQVARQLLLSHHTIIVRLFGVPRVTFADGHSVGLPPGMPGEVVRMLALHEHGLAVDVVMEYLFPEAPADAARQRLRQVLTRLRGAVGEIVVRQGDRLQMLPAWVDVREFLAATSRVSGAQGPRAVLLAYAALALYVGDLLPDDPHAGWARETRDEVMYRYLAMLDLVSADAAVRGADGTPPEAG